MSVTANRCCSVADLVGLNLRRVTLVSGDKDVPVGCFATHGCYCVTRNVRLNKGRVTLVFWKVDITIRSFAAYLDWTLVTVGLVLTHPLWRTFFHVHNLETSRETAADICVRITIRQGEKESIGTLVRGREVGREAILCGTAHLFRRLSVAIGVRKDLAGIALSDRKPHKTIIGLAAHLCRR